MTPRPGPPRENALPPGPDGPERGTPRTLATLLLAVLTLVGGAPAGGAALPVGVLNSLSLAVAHTPKAPAPTPKTDRTAHPGGPHNDLRRTRAAPSVNGPGTGGRSARDQQPGPRRSQERTAPGQQYAQLLQQRSPTADPTTQTPRAGTGRAHLTGHAPSPSHDGLPPCSPGPILPRGQGEQVTAALSGAPSGRKGALPGVRGPPGTTAGLPTGHPSCSAVLASRPR